MTVAPLIEEDLGSVQFMRRAAAGKRLKERFGFGGKGLLDKLAMTGDGPKMYYYGTRVCLYKPEDIDAWAMARLGAPRSSTSQDRPADLRSKDRCDRPVRRRPARASAQSAHSLSTQ